MVHDLEAITRCEREAEAHVAAGRTDVAAGLFERSLRSRIQTFGPSHPVVLKAAEVFARISNHASSVDLRSTGAHWRFERAEQRLGRTLELLAEVAIESCDAVLPVLFNLTLGNMAALHQRRGENEAALRWLLEADALATMLPVSEVVANNLSLCSILSHLGRHAEAERHAAEAVHLSESEIFALASLRQATEDEGFAFGNDLLQEKVSALAVAYNNLAVQREFLGHAGECLALYEKAVVLAEGHMQEDNPLLAKLRGSHRNALQLHAERRFSSMGTARASFQHNCSPQRSTCGAGSRNARKSRAAESGSFLPVASAKKSNPKAFNRGMAQLPSDVGQTSGTSTAGARSNDERGNDSERCLHRCSSMPAVSAGSNDDTLSASKLFADPSSPLPYHMKKALTQVKVAEADSSPNCTKMRLPSSASTASHLDSADADDRANGSLRGHGRGGAATIASNFAVTQVLAEALRACSHQTTFGCHMEAQDEKMTSQLGEQVSELSTGTSDNISSERNPTAAGPQRALLRARQEAATIRIQRAYKRFCMAIRDKSPISRNDSAKPAEDPCLGKSPISENSTGTPFAPPMADSLAPEPAKQEPLPRPMSLGASQPVNALPRLSLSLGRSDAATLGSLA
eukprot:TRINITY_DN60024_c0_g1_i1.p1 TRINITY_DN60024_c0_g1~~TRINITY_DN60024_c0_g1_i1.p1  ORF type:complete len:630 (+),score=96.72 TRINITY_DN60024_c0_g1_i1:41-1930(+)